MAKTKINAQNGVHADANEKTDRQLIVHAQYIKDFSFENPNAPKVLIENLGQPDVEINVSVAAKIISDNQYEVLLNHKNKKKKLIINLKCIIIIIKID